MRKLIMIVTLLLPIFLAQGQAASVATERKNYEFARGQWFDGQKFIEKKFYTVGGMLTSRKPSRVDSVIDLTGKYVVPPFGEAHNHNVEQSSRLDSVIRMYLEAGIFYVKNPNSLPRVTTPLAGMINIPRSVDVVFSGGGLTADRWRRVGAHAGVKAPPPSVRRRVGVPCNEGPSGGRQPCARPGPSTRTSGRGTRSGGCRPPDPTDVRSRLSAPGVSDRGGVVGDVADDVAVVAASPDERELRWRKVGDGHERDPRSGVERSVPLGDEGAADACGDRLERLVSGHGDGGHGSGTPVPGVDGQPVVTQGSGFLWERDEGFAGDVGEAQLPLVRQGVGGGQGDHDGLGGKHMRVEGTGLEQG